MKVTELALEGVKLLELDYYGDNRGYYVESYSKERLKQYGIDLDFVQDSHSYSAKKGTVRGIHFQNNPRAQAKLVRCVRGAIMDVVVDLRKESPTFGQWISTVISAENRLQLFIPRGFGHGFKTLEDDCDFLYKLDDFYAPEYDRAIMWNDPDIAIDWGIENPILSDKDKKAPRLQDSDVNF